MKLRDLIERRSAIAKRIERQTTIDEAERRTVSATDPVAGPGGNLIATDRAPE